VKDVREEGGKEVGREGMSFPPSFFNHLRSMYSREGGREGRREALRIPLFFV